MNNCHCGRVIKEAAWPIAEQVEVRRDSQAKGEHEKEEKQSQDNEEMQREQQMNLPYIEKVLSYVAESR